MLYHSAADSFHTQKRRKSAVLRFWAPLLGFRGNVQWSSEAHWKARSSVNWTFSLGVTAEALRANNYWFKIGDFTPTEASWPKISGRSGRPQQPFFFSENYPKWFFVWYKNLGIAFFRFVTMHAFVRQTDRRTNRHTDSFLIAIPRLYSMRRGKKQGVLSREVQT